MFFDEAGARVFCAMLVRNEGVAAGMWRAFGCVQGQFVSLFHERR
jgi:hypothetical protein